MEPKTRYAKSGDPNIATSATEPRTLPRLALRGRERRPLEDLLTVRFPALARRLGALATPIVLGLPRRSRVRAQFVEWSAWRSLNAFRRDDLEPVRAIWHPDCVLDVSEGPGGEVFSRQLYRGHEGLAAWHAEWGDAWREGGWPDLVSWEEINNRVFLLDLKVRGVGRESGVPVEADLFQLAEFRDGLVWRVVSFSDRSAAVDAARAANPNHPGMGEPRTSPWIARRGKTSRPLEDRLALRFPALATRINGWLARVTLRLPRRWRLRHLLIEATAWRVYNAISRGDLDVLRTFNHPDTVWDLSRAVIGEAELYHGRDGVVRFNEEWLGEWSEWDLDLASIEEVKAGVFFVHLRSRAVGRASGAPVEMDYFQILRLRGGLTWRGTFFTKRADALADVGLAE